MVGSSKILTVGYGTFSCTLEGFDDSFDTMKAIAEYFRDLAADDRYFGAEPPTPDAEMLAQIAEREIARRVEARMETSGIVLRPVAEQAAEQAAAVVQQSVAEPVAEAAVESAPEAQAPAMPPPAEVAGPQPAPAKLAKAAEALAIAAEVAAETNAPSEEAEVASEPVAEETPEVVAEAAPAQPVEEPVADKAEPVEDDTVAAKLARIRSVVGKAAAQNAPQDEEFIEDLEPAEAEVIAETAEQPEALDLASVMEATETDAVEPVVAEAPEVADTPETTDETAENDALVNALLSEDTSEESEAEAPAEVEAEVETAEATAEEAPVEDTPAEQPKADAEPTVKPNRPRVIRMKRADFERVLNEGQMSKVAEAAATSDDVVVEPDLNDILATSDDADESEDYNDLDGLDDFDLPDLDIDDEGDILGDFSSELEDTADEDNIEDDEEVNAFADIDLDDTDEAPRAGRAVMEQEPVDDEEALSRILSRTDAQLSDPENDQRRQNLSHLKAAVAATEAARKMGEAVEDEDAIADPFRDDLDQVIKPRRPVIQKREDAPEAKRTERPRPAPLKLVASQRVDAENPGDIAEEAVAPVRPRRVAPTEAPAKASTAESFSEFAEEAGAHSLPELLEAAAAYASFVEGLDDFSRPQVMKKVQEVNTEFNREDGLRTFGTLLREGRISKVRNGRFQISEQTRYKPEPRAARG